ncbi:MAG TPA: response regulator [Ktedonobacterales bacterium]|nr:response regulator [Ktedonobacterales bacterium]
MGASLPLVLVADPDPLYQQQLVKLLEPSFRCVVTGSLRETVQALQRERPVLLVIDVDQPDGDGIVLIRQMQSHPDFRGVLIACVTRRSSIKDKILAFQAGVDDYLIKPLTQAMNFYGRMLLLRRAGHIARMAR